MAGKKRKNILSLTLATYTNGKIQDTSGYGVMLQQYLSVLTSAKGPWPNTSIKKTKRKMTLKNQIVEKQRLYAKILKENPGSEYLAQLSREIAEITEKLYPTKIKNSWKH